MGQGNKRRDEAPVQKSSVTTGDQQSGSASADIPPLIINTAPSSIPPVISLRVSPQLVSDAQTDTVNVPLPPVFYVIVGRGPAATINHTTLLQSDWGRDRTDRSEAGKLPVLHIGFSNPWSAFFSHGMGQPTYLLSLPGFHPDNQPDIRGKDSIKDGGLTSTVFGACVDDELSWCLTEERKRWDDARPRVAAFERHGWPVLNGWVGWIQSKGGLEPLFKPEVIANEATGAKVQKAMLEKLAEKYPDFPTGVAPYRLLVLRDQDGEFTPDFIYAQYIDFCTGSGRPRQDRKEFKTARLEPWRDPATWTGTLKTRKIVVATEAVRREFDWDGGQRICIANGGAIALNAAERARDEACWTDWFHVTTLLDSFGNPRNFTFIKHKTEDRCREPEAGVKLTEPEMIAADQRTRLGRSTEAETATETGTGVNVTLKKGVPRDKSIVVDTPLIRDYQKHEHGIDPGTKSWLFSEWYRQAYTSARLGKVLPSTEYDRLIFHTGLVLNDLGQPYHCGCREKLNPIRGKGSRMTGLETFDGRVRVLGAASQMYPELPPFDAKNPGFAPSDAMWVFRLSLPVSAVPDGFILSGLNIAEANQFFSGSNKNTNVNTMTQDEIHDALSAAGLSYFTAKELAEAIVTARNEANGFASVDDLRTKVMVPASKNIEAVNKQTVAQQIDAGYKEYVKKKEEVEKLKKVLTSAEDTRKLDETLKLMHDNEVSRQAHLLMTGEEDLKQKRKAAADAAAKLDSDLKSNSALIAKGLKFSY